MPWPFDDTDDRERKQPKSKYWSDICKDIGKYVITGGVAAPFLSIAGAAFSIALFFLALVVGGAILYLGYRLAPDEPPDSPNK
jgi:hypothetical protein